MDRRDEDLRLLGDDPALLELAERLRSGRPVPAPGFRGMLRRRIDAAPGDRVLRRRALSLLATGMALLAVATAGVAGAGPLSAPGVGEDGAATATGSAARSPASGR